jgi:hypothetical protein
MDCSYGWVRAAQTVRKKQKKRGHFFILTTSFWGNFILALVYHRTGSGVPQNQSSNWPGGHCRAGWPGEGPFVVVVGVASSAALPC